MNRFKLNKLNRLNKNVLLILFLVFSVLFVLGCSVSYAIITPQPTITIVPSVTQTIVGEFQCVVTSDALNVRECASYKCQSIGKWGIKGNILMVNHVSSDGQWYFINEYSGYVNKNYCEVKK